MSEPILRRFCLSEDEKCRYDIHSPFNQGGWRYGTDERAAVRERTTGSDTRGKKLPPMAEV